MSLPKEIYTFILIEFIHSKGVLPKLIGVEGNYYEDKSGNRIKIARDLFKTSLTEVEGILNSLSYSISDFQYFCESYMQSEEFENKLKNSFRQK